MSKDKGIFEPKEGFASEPPARSPFAIDDAAESPFASSPESSKSPFSMDDDEATRLTPGGAGNSPDKRNEPFSTGDSKSPFGYEPPVAGFGGSPFEGSPSPAASKDSPFAVADTAKSEPAAASPFSEAKTSGPSDAVAAAVAAAAGGPPSTPASTPPPLAATPEPAPAPAATPAATATSSEESDSTSIRQLELRAIFGVDRELSESEILQRSRGLPGIRHLGRVASADIGMIDGIKRVLANLDFGGGKVQLQCNNAPIEFIREGSVLLAVQTDGSFAPGVRETLIIAARELGKM
ncbi:hypothetical protein [Haloferula sp.]|uniref:hypothetical protein n=1 Tax=Haloferula sp. TaxID=2497595 RepID=UPI003C7570CE